MSKNIKFFKSELSIRILSAVAVVLWMGVIFMFSSETATESTKTSGNVVEIIVKIFTPDYDSLSVAEQTALKDSISGLVRTAAHFLSFAALGFLSFIAIVTYKIKTLNQALLSWVISIVYSCFDEVHQYFVPGRAFQLEDIAVDTMGALVGVLVFWFFLTMFKKCRKEKKNDTKN